MIRKKTPPRTGWQGFLEKKLGFRFHSYQSPYWAEGVYYQFESAEIDRIEKATFDLHDLCIELLHEVIDDDQKLERIGVPARLIPLIRNSWNEDHFYLYGRMDLAYDGVNPPKLLEYNADTPTSLLEAAIVQWQWLEQVFPGKDQFNLIHEKLVSRWKTFPSDRLHFTCAASESPEDKDTVMYLLDTFLQADLGPAKFVALEDIGSDGERLLDRENYPVENLFKLYPWTWICEEEFFAQIQPENLWIEPAWKTVLSSKGLLALLWEKYPDHPNLLEASFEPLQGDFVKKPFFSREGMNVLIQKGGNPLEETDGPAECERFVYQRFIEIPSFDGCRPVLGSWVVGNDACGMGIRECEGYITGNTSRFVPHLF